MSTPLEITSGQSIIRIKTHETGSYFVINNPLAIIWDAGGGTFEQYFTLTHYSSSNQKQRIQKIQDSLYKDYTNQENLLVEEFTEVWDLLENGTYEISFEKSNPDKEYFYLSYNDTIRMTNLILFNNQKPLEENALHADWGGRVMIGYFSKSFYDHSYGEDNFIFTRAMESIDLERVDFFETEIKNGKRPFAIVIRKEYTERGHDYIHHSNSGWYTIDGHHKLLAYQNLHIKPPLLKIKQQVSKSAFNNFNLLELKDVLMPCQYYHIKETLY